MTDDKTLVLTGTPDNIDYAKLAAASKEAEETGYSVVVHEICLECPSVTTVPPPVRGEVAAVAVEHEDWCPILALHEGRELTPRQRRYHQRYMDQR
jgi:hypothetical protein